MRLTRPVESAEAAFDSVASLRIPELDVAVFPIVTSGDDPLAIGRPVNGRYGFAVMSQREDFFSGRAIPDHGAAIPATRHKL